VVEWRVNQYFEDRDGPLNIGLLTFQPPDMAASQRILYWNQIYKKKIQYQPVKLSVTKCVHTCIKLTVLLS